MSEGVPDGSGDPDAGLMTPPSTPDATLPDADGPEVDDASLPDTPDADAAAPPAPDADVMEPPFTGGPCGDTRLGSLLSLTTIPDARGRGYLRAAPTPAGGAILGWLDDDGLKVTWVDGTGRRVMRDTSIPGDALWGLSVGGGRWAAMTFTEPDILTLVTMNPGGGEVTQERLLGGVPHDVVGNEWFGRLIRQADLIWTGEHFAAYYTVNRLWPDGIAHYGDQLRLFTPRGVEVREVWDWGCSHSMELRVAHNGSDLGAVCASDCYPSKGIHFNHRGGLIYEDVTRSNCAGRYGTTLGGLVPQGDGFWVAFTATEDRMSPDVGLRRVAGRGRSMSEIIWLTNDDVNDIKLRFARHGDALLVAYRPGRGDALFVRANLISGAPMGAPVAIPEVDLLTATDFFSYANGDVGWVQRDGEELILARLRHCDGS